MSFPRFDRLVLSDGGPLLIQYISDACVSSRQNDKQCFLYLRTNQRRLRGELLSWRCIGIELSEESEEKERKVAAQKRVAQRRIVLRVKKEMWLRMGTWWLWKAEFAHEFARSLRTILPLVCQNHLFPCFWHLPS